MPISEIEAKSILRKHKRIDSWFISHYSLNFYRGCTHNCTYCDGRTENYYVVGDFGKDIVVKTNAIEILRKEIQPTKRKKPLKKSFMIPGGGVGDSYEPLEQKYQLTKKALELFYEFEYPVHILTKSTLVKRDIEILRKINQQNRAIVNFSFSSVNERMCKIFEPGASTPRERLETISYLRDEGIHTGIFLLPVIPFITDTPEMIESTIYEAKNAGAEFIIFSGMTLKEGKQKDYFMNILNNHFPNLSLEYEKIYKDNKWGGTIHEYNESINYTFDTFAKKYKIPKRIPAYLYNNILSENDLVIVLLEQIDYLLRLKGFKSNYGYAAYAIRNTSESLSTIRNKLGQIKGIGPSIRKIIWEILDTGTSKYYEQLLIN